MNLTALKERAMERIARAESSADQALAAPWSELFDACDSEEKVRAVIARYPEYDFIGR